eukprot:m.53067 g.53067  ORF g.53067 m.53067 type:complete len:323 (+) comp10839_c0_seq2:40-1008(+)
MQTYTRKALVFFVSAIFYTSVLVKAELTACKVAASGDNPAVDLNELGRIGSDFVIPSKDYPGFEFVTNICRNLTFVDTRCVPGSTVCNRHTNTRVGSDVYGTVNETKASYEDDELVLKSSGDTCSSDQTKKFESEMIFVCDSAAERPVMSIKYESFYGCYVTFEVKTSLVCKKGPSPAPSPSPPSPSPPSPSPPSPGPSPPSEKYTCDHGECVPVKAGGVDKKECEDFCVHPPPSPPAPSPPSPAPSPPSPAPSPAEGYKCTEGKCVESPGGVSKSECENVCVAETYKCVAQKCEVSQDGGVPKETCEKICSSSNPVYMGEE